MVTNTIKTGLIVPIEEKAEAMVVVLLAIAEPLQEVVPEQIQARAEEAIVVDIKEIVATKKTPFKRSAISATSLAVGQPSIARKNVDNHKTDTVSLFHLMGNSLHKQHSIPFSPITKAPKDGLRTKT